MADFEFGKVLSEAEADRIAIEEYRQKLQEFDSLYGAYNTTHAVTMEALEQIAASMTTMDTAKRTVDRRSAEIDEFIEEKSHKRLFLEELQKKSKLTQFRYRKYEEHAREELSEGSEVLEKRRNDYTKAVDMYNDSVRKLEEELERLRTAGILADEQLAFEQLVAFTELAVQDGFAPKFHCAEFGEYKDPDFKLDIHHNRPVLLAELKKMDRFLSLLPAITAGSRAEAENP